MNTYGKMRKYFPLIKLLTKKGFSRENFTGLIECLDDNTVKFICECARNVISVNHFSQLSARQKSVFLRKILPHRRLIERLCKKQNSYKIHRKMIAQKGYGFIIPMLTAVVPLIASMMSKLASGAAFLVLSMFMT